VSCSKAFLVVPWESVVKDEMDDMLAVSETEVIEKECNEADALELTHVNPFKWAEFVCNNLVS